MQQVLDERIGGAAKSRGAVDRAGSDHPAADVGHQDLLAGRQSARQLLQGVAVLGTRQAQGHVRDRVRPCRPPARRSPGTVHRFGVPAPVLLQGCDEKLVETHGHVCYSTV